MASKNPLGKIAGAAVGSLKDPVGTAGKILGQAKGSAAFGLTVLGRAAETASAVLAQRHEEAEEEPTLRSAPDVNEPAHTVTPPAKRPGPAAKKSTAAKAPAKKAPAKKAPAKKATAGAEPAATPEDLARRTTGEPAKKAAKKTTAKKTAAAKEPAKKTTAKRPPTKKAPPKTAEQVATGQGEDVDTPAGTPGAGRATNPDTAEHDLDQPGTEGLMEESTASESETLRKAAEREPE